MTVTIEEALEEIEQRIGDQFPGEDHSAFSPRVHRELLLIHATLLQAQQMERIADLLNRFRTGV